MIATMRLNRLGAVGRCKGRSEVCCGLSRRRPNSMCQQCGKSYCPKQRDRVTFCSRSCGYQWGREQARYRNAMKAWAAEHYYYQVYIEKSLRACDVCGVLFVPAGNQLRCSEECAYEALKALKRRQYVPVKRTCIVTGKMFAVGRGGAKCHPSVRRRMARLSKSAGNHRRRVKLRNGVRESVNVVKVFVRDGWRCQLCGKKTDKRRKTPSKSAPTLDHIIPVSKGGSHTYDNVQLLCFECNCSKGAKDMKELVLCA